jgi:hypothetical protein
MIQQRYTTLTLRMWHSIDQTVMRLLTCTVPTEVLGNSSTCKQTMQGWQPKDTKGIILGTLCSIGERYFKLFRTLVTRKWTLCECNWPENVPFGIPWNQWKIGSPLRQMMWQRLHAWLPHCAPLNSCKSRDSPAEWLCFVGENMGMNCLAMNFLGITCFRESHSFVCFSCFFNIGIRRLGWLLSVHQPFFMLPRATRFSFTAGYALPAVPSEILRGGVGTQWCRWDKKNGYDWYML